MKRLILFLNGIQAIRTEPLDEKTREFRIENWRIVFGHGVKIEVVAG